MTLRLLGADIKDSRAIGTPCGRKHRGSRFNHREHGGMHRGTRRKFQSPWAKIQSPTTSRRAIENHQRINPERVTAIARGRANRLLPESGTPGIRRTPSLSRAIGTPVGRRPRTIACKTHHHRGGRKRERRFNQVNISQDWQRHKNPNISHFLFQHLL